MDVRWCNTSETLCSDQVRRVLLNSRRDSTRKTYLAKWSRFTHWCDTKGLNPSVSPLHAVLDYVLHLHTSGISIPSLKVHLAVITAFHRPINGRSVFAHPITKRFLKGLHNLNPPHRPSPPVWNLNLMLDVLTRSPFDLLATTSLQLLTTKVVFLIAITSARRMSKIAALMASPPYTIFNKDSVILRLHPTFHPKVCSDFHINEPVVFPKVYASPQEALLHMLDARRASHFILIELVISERQIVFLYLLQINLEVVHSLRSAFRS